MRLHGVRVFLCVCVCVCCWFNLRAYLLSMWASRPASSRLLPSSATTEHKVHGGTFAAGLVHRRGSCENGMCIACRPDLSRCNQREQW